MLSIVYVSTEAQHVTDEDLARILVVTRAKNSRLGVTGMLAHRGSNCLGILEGDDDVVLARFEEIRHDPRHTNVRQLCADTITTRAFPEWSMAFQPADPLIKDMPGFVDLFAADRPQDSLRAQSRARALLEWFRLHPLAPLTAQQGEDRVEPRVRIINAAITVLHRIGVARCTAQLVGDEAGLSAAEVEEHFPTRESLMTATLERWSGAISRPLLPLAAELGAVAYLHALVAAYAEEPALMRLLASTLAASTDDGAEGAEYYQTLYLRFRRTIRDALVTDVRTGREPASMDPERGAQQLLAIYDGFRIQALLVPGFDIVDAFARAATRLRRGWSEEYHYQDLFELPVAPSGVSAQ